MADQTQGVLKIAMIFRGVPGSGKSTMAQVLGGPFASIHSTDSYFMEDGIYKFDPRKLGEYHTKNLEAFTNSMRNGASVVICDNTNVRRDHFAPYVKAAEENGYKVVIVTIPHPDPEVAAERNKHGVPESAIRRMIAQWEA